jgi:hypothetical protein
MDEHFSGVAGSGRHRDHTRAQDAEVFLTKVLPFAPDVVVQVAHLAGSGNFPPNAEQAMKVFEAAIQHHDPRTRNLYFDQCAVATTLTSAEEAAVLRRLFAASV